MPRYYPLFMDIKARPVLVVGGGLVALRKVQVLLEHEAIVHIVSPKLLPELRKLVNEKTCLWQEKEYSTGDIKDAVLVFSCTEKEDVNKLVSLDAQAQYRPVNVVDDPEKCSFIVPSIMERGDLKIAVSTGGSSPIAARQIRTELESLYGQDMEDYLHILKVWRNKVKSGLPADKRIAFWKRATDGEVRKLIKAQQFTEAEGVMETCFLSLLD